MGFAIIRRPHGRGPDAGARAGWSTAHVAGAALAAIADALPRLARLALNDVGLTDGGVEQLSALRELRELTVTRYCKPVMGAARRKALGIAC